MIKKETKRKKLIETRENPCGCRERERERERASLLKTLFSINAQTLEHCRGLGRKFLVLDVCHFVKCKIDSPINKINTEIHNNGGVRDGP